MKREKIGLFSRCVAIVATPLMAAGLLVAAALVYGFSLKKRDYGDHWRGN